MLRPAMDTEIIAIVDDDRDHDGIEHPIRGKVSHHYVGEADTFDLMRDDKIGGGGLHEAWICGDFNLKSWEYVAAYIYPERPTSIQIYETLRLVDP